MKRILIILSLFAMVTGLCVYAAEITKFSSKFVKHFKDCDLYEETVNSEFQGQTFTTKRSIQGWRNGFCRYQETVSSKDAKYQINCGFSDLQVDDLYESMKDRSKKVERYNLDLFAPKVDQKTGETKYVKDGSTVIKGNKAYITWAKYQNNPYFCSFKELQ